MKLNFCTYSVERSTDGATLPVYHIDSSILDGVNLPAELEGLDLKETLQEINQDVEAPWLTIAFDNNYPFNGYFMELRRFKRYAPIWHYEGYIPNTWESESSFLTGGIMFETRGIFNTLAEKSPFLMAIRKLLPEFLPGADEKVLAVCFDFGGEYCTKMMDNNTARAEKHLAWETLVDGELSKPRVPDCALFISQFACWGARGGNYEKAFERGMALADRGYSSSFFHRHMVRVCLEQKNLELALKYLDLSKQEIPDHKECLLAEAEVAKYIGDHSLHKACLAKLIEIDPYEEFHYVEMLDVLPYCGETTEDIEECLTPLINLEVYDGWFTEGVEWKPFPFRE